MKPGSVQQKREEKRQKLLGDMRWVTNVLRASSVRLREMMDKVTYGNGAKAGPNEASCDLHDVAVCVENAVAVMEAAMEFQKTTTRRNKR
jgi:hypothetical protein